MKVCKPIPKKLVEEASIEEVQTKLRETYDRNLRKVDNAIVFSNPEKKSLAFIIFFIIGMLFTYGFFSFIIKLFA